MSIFHSTSMQMLEKGLAGAQLEQKAISRNIANIDTPHYKAKRSHFQHTLQEAVDGMKAVRTQPEHVEFGGKPSQAYLKTDHSTLYNHNGNNVDVDKEMSKLATNQIYYNALSDRLGSKYNSLKTAVKGG